ncbi:MAG: spore coat protein [Oscillospiraceae bacterium]|jgi:hypothetical protein|nr:spore coat protein [Oscillospiraceae bacterium]
MEKERVIMEQALAAQDEITGQYSETANHCGSTPVKMAFLNLLGEEHRIQHELYSELHRRGWRKEEAAQKGEVQELCQWVKRQGGVY